MAAGTVTFHYIEGWSWVDSFYFSSVAGTTVGFGDLAPTTDTSKLVSVVYIFFGVGILGSTAVEASPTGLARAILDIVLGNQSDVLVPAVGTAILTFIVLTLATLSFGRRELT